VFGAEKNKLVIQPLGVVCIECLWRCSPTCLTMATRTRWRRNKIEYAVNGDSGIDEIYENLCGKTLEDIKSPLKRKNKS
jgi:hypothetical protein